MNKYIKSLILLLIIINVISITGCWDNRNIDDMSLIKGIAIDTVEETDRIKFTVQIVKPVPGEGGAEQQQGGGTNITETISATGYTLQDAGRNLIKQIGRRPYYGHNDIIIVSDEIARKGIKPYLDFLLRNKEVRGRTGIIIAKKSAAEILETPHYLEDVTASGIKKMVNGVAESGTISGTNLIPFNMDIINQKTDAVTSFIELREGGPEEETQSNQNNNQNLVFASGGAVFKEDKFQGQFTRKEARGYNWVKNPEEIRGPILVKTKSKKNENEKRISIEIRETQSKIKPEIKENKLKIKIEINTRGFIHEEMPRDYDIMEQENIDNLNKRFATVVNNEILNTLKKSRQYQADVFGLAQAVDNKYPDKFKQIKNEWDDIYLNIPVEINVKATIKRTGMLD
ncbi:MAG: Ger(x)C family spore germination protein [Bacillota bacterium]